MSSSNITYIDQKLMEAILEGVQYLDIRENNLKTLPRTIVNVDSACMLWISNNPYECNCDMIWMKDWLTNSENVKDKHNVTCSGHKMKGKGIKNVMSPILLFIELPFLDTLQLATGAFRLLSQV